ncbi:hypothetical protein [Ferruginibacter sp.]|nr:hypothetical protein [Ferruginibacter sp.]
MQDKTEHIFELFIKNKLNDFTPDVTLQDSSFNNFLSEWQKKKKRRFLGLLIILLFTVLSLFYFPALMQKTSVNKVDANQSNNSQPTKYIQSDSVSNSTNKDYTKIINITKPDTINLQSNGNKNPKIRNSKKADSSSLKNNYKNVFNKAKNTKYAVDSVLFKIQNKLPLFNYYPDSLTKKSINPLTDTFHIIW